MSATSVATAEAFSLEVVAPLVKSPEVILPQADVDSLLAQAATAGLTEPSVDPDALRVLARVNAGVAFGVHRMALEARLRSRLGFPKPPHRGAVSLTGHYGLGRDALPRLLARRPLSDVDVSLLTDYFHPRLSRLVVSAGWGCLLTAGFDGKDIVWRQLEPSDFTADAQPHSHGFDELETALVSSVATGPTISDTGAYVAALYADMLALVAIGSGIVEHALVIARSFAAERRQGGQTIEGYPAVQQMLAQISATARAGVQHLAWFAAQPANLESLTELCAARSQFHVACCVAANNAIQVLGGRGYMQDFGPEKLAREANTLRVLAGTPMELQLFVAEMERTS